MGGAIFNMQGRLDDPQLTLASNAAIGGRDPVPDSGKGIGGAVFNMSGSFTAVGSHSPGTSADHDGASIYNLVYDGNSARQADTTLRGTIVADGLGAAGLVSIKTAFHRTAAAGHRERRRRRPQPGAHDGCARDGHHHRLAADRRPRARPASRQRRPDPDDRPGARGPASTPA